MNWPFHSDVYSIGGSNTSHEALPNVAVLARNGRVCARGVQVHVIQCGLLHYVMWSWEIQALRGLSEETQNNNI